MESIEKSMEEGEEIPRLILPYEDKKEWENVCNVLQRPLESLTDLDIMITEFHSRTTKQKCKFFSKIPGSRAESMKIDFTSFWKYGVPLMVKVALEMPILFNDLKLPLLLRKPEGGTDTVQLTRRQCACLLAHSFFGSITSDARRVRKEKWAFRASQLFILESIPSALCFLNYWKILGRDGIPEGTVTFARSGFASRRHACSSSASPMSWSWECNTHPLCSVNFHYIGAMEEDSSADLNVDFANRFVGGGCLENDFNQEEILFVCKPECIVSMALCSYMTDEDVIRISGALQYSCYSGYGSTFQFEGDADHRGIHGRGNGLPPTIVAMDALQGCSKIQFKEGMILRDLNKARIAFEGASSIATGNWGTGAFGNDHFLKFLQQWMAASDANVKQLHYYTYGDRRCEGLDQLSKGLKQRGSTVGGVWEAVKNAAKQCEIPCLGNSKRFRKLMMNEVGIVWD